LNRAHRALAADTLLALCLAFVGVFGTAAVGSRTSADRPVDGWAFALVLTAAGLLMARRRWTLAALTGVTLATSTYLVAGYPYGPILLSFFVAVYTAARRLPLRTSVPAAVVALAVLLLHVFGEGNPLGVWLSLIPGTAWVVAPFAIGVGVRLGQESRAQDRAEVIRQAVYEERMRVAQDVHDVVGHGLAAIKMQADVALHVLSRKPGQAELALKAISTTSAAALEELRATLVVVRQSDDSRAATPGLAMLGDLEKRMTHAGVRLRILTSGEPRELPPAVDLAAYRVVQEALTNVLRHADSQAATVRVRYDLDTITVEVTNPGEAVPVSRIGEGTGIAGMRERAVSLGGTFSAAPSPDGGFRVRAALPIGGLG